MTEVVQSTEAAAVTTPVVTSTTEQAQTSSPVATTVQEKILGKFSTQKDLESAYQHLEQTLGKKFEQWTKDDIRSISKKFDAPEKAEEYSIPEGINQDAANRFKEIAFKAGLSKDQAKNVLDDLIEHERSNIKQSELKINETKTSWQKQLSEQFGKDKDLKIANSDRAMSALGGEDLKKVLTETGVIDHPLIRKAFNEIEEKFLSEHRYIASDRRSVIGTETPEAAADMLNKLMINNKALTDDRHPEHKAVVAEWNRLIEAKHAK